MRRRSMVVAGVGAVLLVTAGASADAVTVPSWPVAGRVPSCDSATLVSSSSSGYQMAYADTTVPAIASMVATPTIVIGPGVNTIGTLTVRATDSCSGVLGGIVLMHATGAYHGLALTAATSDAFHSTLTYTLGPVSSATTPGVVEFLTVMVWDRYASLTVDQNGALVASTPRVIGAATPFGSYAGPVVRTYLLRRSLLTSTVSRTSVTKAHAVTISGVLTGWAGSTYLPHNLGIVVLQRRKGSHPWQSIAKQASGGGTGAVSFTVKPTATAAYRLSFAPATSTLFAPAVSPVRVVSVTG